LATAIKLRSSKIASERRVVSATKGKSNKAIAHDTPSGRPRRPRAALPPLPGQKWANFASLAAMSSLSESSIDKLARAGEFESFKPFPNAGRLGDVASFEEMMSRRAAEGPRFGEQKGKPAEPGKRPRGRPRKQPPSSSPPGAAS
jgi:hypothetical protein